MGRDDARRGTGSNISRRSVHSQRTLQYVAKFLEKYQYDLYKNRVLTKQVLHALAEDKTLKALAKDKEVFPKLCSFITKLLERLIPVATTLDNIEMSCLFQFGKNQVPAANYLIYKATHVKLTLARQDYFTRALDQKYILAVIMEAIAEQNSVLKGKSCSIYLSEEKSSQELIDCLTYYLNLGCISPNDFFLLLENYPKKEVSLFYLAKYFYDLQDLKTTAEKILAINPLSLQLACEQHSEISDMCTHLFSETNNLEFLYLSMIHSAMSQSRGKIPNNFEELTKSHPFINEHPMLSVMMIWEDCEDVKLKAILARIRIAVFKEIQVCPMESSNVIPNICQATNKWLLTQDQESYEVIKRFSEAKRTNSPSFFRLLNRNELSNALDTLLAFKPLVNQASVQPQMNS